MGFPEPLQNANNFAHIKTPSLRDDRGGLSANWFVVFRMHCDVKIHNILCLYLACADMNCQPHKRCHGDQLSALTPLRSLTLIPVPVKCIITMADFWGRGYRTGHCSDWEPQEDLEKWAHCPAPSSLKLTQIANQRTPQPEPPQLQSFIPLKEGDVNHFYNPQINHSEMLHQSFATSPAGTSHLAPSTPLWGRKQFAWFKSLSLWRFTIILEFILLHNYLKGNYQGSHNIIQFRGQNRIHIANLSFINSIQTKSDMCCVVFNMLCNMLLCDMLLYVIC